MFPELFKIPYLNFTLNTYGLLLAVSFLLGLYLMATLAERDGLDKKKVYDLGLWVLAASLIGSKLLMVVTEWDYYRQFPGQIFSLDFLRSGGVFYGGFLGAVIASVVVTRIYQLPWWPTADVFAPGIALGQAIGRLGCFSAGCCWGRPTDQAWGVHFSERGHEVTGVPTLVEHIADPAQRQLWADKLGSASAALHLHPTQLYEVAATSAILLTLLWLRRRRQFSGQIILTYAALYAVARFIIEFWRDDPRGAIFGLSTSQFIAVLLLIASSALYLYRARRARLRVTASDRSVIA
jgi:phosphatidylglycerol:prolipoprotein diacylglycerol transferase